MISLQPPFEDKALVERSLFSFRLHFGGSFTAAARQRFRSFAAALRTHGLGAFRS